MMISSWLSAVLLLGRKRSAIGTTMSPLEVCTTPQESLSAKAEEASRP